MKLALPFRYDDGGHAVAGLRGRVGDCGVRAICIATKQPYMQVCRALHDAYVAEHKSRAWVAGYLEATGKGGSYEEIDEEPERFDLRRGLPAHLMQRYLASIGWSAIHDECDNDLLTLVDLRNEAATDLPPTCIVQVPGHFIAIRDGVVRDTFRHRGPFAFRVWMPDVTRKGMK